MASTSGTFQCHIRFHRRSLSFLLLRWSSLNGWAASFFVVSWQWWRRTAAEPQRSPGFQVSFSFHRRFIVWAYEVFAAFACARFQHYFLIQFEHLESPNSNCRYRNRKSWQVLFFSGNDKVCCTRSSYRYTFSTRKLALSTLGASDPNLLWARVVVSHQVTPDILTYPDLFGNIRRDFSMPALWHGRLSTGL